MRLRSPGTLIEIKKRSFPGAAAGSRLALSGSARRVHRGRAGSAGSPPAVREGAEGASVGAGSYSILM
jgi:hypothetical protein